MVHVFLYKKDWKELERLFSNLEATKKDLSLSAKDGLAVDVCLEEVFTNILKYSKLTNDDDYAIFVKFERNGQCLSCTVEDRGQPFNLLRDFLPEALTLEEEGKSHMGIKLISALMDQVDYSYNNHWNQVTLLKLLT